MKTIYFLLAVFLLGSINVNAQFVDDLEYPDGIPESSYWWTCWLNETNCMPFIVGPGGAHEGEYSGLIPGDEITEEVLDLDDRIFGEWGLEFYMYVPSGKEAFWNLQGTVPIGAGEWIVGFLYFNQDLATPGQGIISDTALGEITFNFPHDEWFRVAMNFDLSLGIASGTWGMSIDNSIVVPEGTAFTNLDGDIPTSLGGVSFYSISPDNEYYIDTFNHINGFLELEPIAGVDDITSFNFSIFPNPAVNNINISTTESIEKIHIYSMQGTLVKETNHNKTIDISNLSNGLYFMEINTEKEKSIQKFIKN